jgi:16S rRNA processing protein RimM
MFIAIGKIIKTHGTNGYVKAISYSGVLERFLNLKTLYLEIDDEEKGMILEDIILQDRNVLLKFNNIDNREDAVKLVRKELKVLFEEKIKLPENNYFIHDLIGLKVFDIEGNYLGIIENVLQMGANDIYQVKHEDDEILIPAVGEFIKNISLEEKKIVVKLIEGMRIK